MSLSRRSTKRWRNPRDSQPNFFFPLRACRWFILRSLSFSRLTAAVSATLVPRQKTSLITMRLITHNLLACHARTCTQTSNNFPLRFEQITKLELIEADFNEAFVRGFLPKVDWDALVSAARSLGSDVGEGLPKAAPDLDDPMLDQELLKKVHHVLLEVSLGRAWREQRHGQMT